MQSEAKDAKDVMTHKLITIRGTESLIAAWKQMREKKIRHLPVVDEDGGVIGILTDRDLQRAIHTEFDQNGEVRFTIERFSPGERVIDYMTSPVRTVSNETPLISVATQMLEQKISSLLVTDAKEVVGIITTDDLLWALIRRLDSDKEPTLKKLLASLYASPVGPIVNQLSASGL